MKIWSKFKSRLYWLLLEDYCKQRDYNFTDVVIGDGCTITIRCITREDLDV